MSGILDIARFWLDWMVAVSWQIALFVCLIGVLTWALRGASARLRYGLWLLVLVKALLPPTLAVFWGIGNWGVAPVAEFGRQAGAGAIDAVTFDQEGRVGEAIGDGLPAMLQEKAGGLTIAGALLAVWLIGSLSLWFAVVWRYWRLVKTIGAMRQIDEGPARVELERLANRLGVRRVPELFVSAQPTSPMLIGVVRPKIVLPENVLARMDENELQMILAHEIVHWRRRDTWVGWLQVFVQGMLWFHPFVWLANARIRHERECACDEMVLRDGRCGRDDYGETLLRVLTAARGRSLVRANMVGVFERGSRLQTRLEEIMSFDPMKRRFGWLSRAAVVAAALLLLPMAAPSVSAEGDDGRVATARKAEKEDGQKSEAPQGRPRRAAAKRPKTNWPVIVKSSPEIGATDVDPAITEISVTFDRDMDVGGYSWTGAGPDHPPTPEGESAVWTDKRTCVLPVQLEKGKFYRVGINSSSHQNFRSAMGVPAETTAIYFATKGAPRGVAARTRVPKIVKSTPEIGATDVDPRLGLISVTFNMPMDTGGFSWTGGGPSFPTIPDGQKPRWSRDGKTCTLPVKLAPGKHYELGLNNVSHKNFGSKWGVPLEPVHFEFTTAGDAMEDAADANDATGKAPRIVKMIPENGATDVDPSLKAIRVTFNRPMAAGFSWTGGGEKFPTIPDGKKPRWSDDRKTCVLPVSLKPDWEYRLGLNSPSFKNFASADGVPLEPVIYEFRTSPGDE
jgi:beta-lactamase regulating signal transducer with metallopeptidase domain